MKSTLAKSDVELEVDHKNLFSIFNVRIVEKGKRRKGQIGFER